VIAVLDSVVAGAVAAIAALGLGAGTAVAVVVGIVTFAITVAAFVAFAVWAISQLRRRIVVRFPKPPNNRADR
jgi:hypothetical protein